MNDDDRGIERRPARTASDTRLATEVAVSVRFLLSRFPGMHVCTDYSDPLMVRVHCVGPDGEDLGEEWISR